MACRVEWISAEKERGLVASKSIQEGDVIFSEHPIVCAQYLYNSIYFPACAFCMKSLEVPSQMLRRLSESQESISLPAEESITVYSCMHCVQEDYCSEECRTEAWTKFHSVLCAASLGNQRYEKYQQLLEYWKSIEYPPETATITLVCRFYAMLLTALKNGSSFDDAFAPFKSFKFQFKNTNGQNISFLEEKFSGNMNFLFNLVKDVFGDFSCFPQIFEWDLFAFFMSLMAMNGQGFGTSSLEIYKQTCPIPTLEYIDSFEDQIEEASGDFIFAEGTGLYSLHSSINHSCEPNAQIVFLENSSRLSVKAIENIAENEEITISYYDLCCEDADFEERQEALQRYYLFTCNCIKCYNKE